MAVIEKKQLQGIPGEFTIKFSKRNYRFEIESPPGSNVIEKIGPISSELFSYSDVRKELDRILETYLFEVAFKRKVIIIQLRTSESKFDTWKDKFVLHKGYEKEKTLTEDFLKQAEGFHIVWHVANEYLYPYEKLKYKLLESNKNFGPCYGYDKMIPIHEHVFSSSYGEVRLLDYREDLHVFLKSLDGSISEMVKNIVSYFDIDEQKFIQNFENNQLKLT